MVTIHWHDSQSVEVQGDKFWWATVKADDGSQLVLSFKSKRELTAFANCLLDASFVPGETMHLKGA